MSLTLSLNSQEPLILLISRQHLLLFVGLCFVESGFEHSLCLFILESPFFHELLLLLIQVFPFFALALIQICNGKLAALEAWHASILTTWVVKRIIVFTLPRIYRLILVKKLWATFRASQALYLKRFFLLWSKFSIIIGVITIQWLIHLVPRSCHQIISFSWLLVHNIRKEVSITAVWLALILSSFWKTRSFGVFSYVIPVNVFDGGEVKFW